MIIFLMLVIVYAPIFFLCFVPKLGMSVPQLGLIEMLLSVALIFNLAMWGVK